MRCRRVDIVILRIVVSLVKFDHDVHRPIVDPANLAEVLSSYNSGGLRSAGSSLWSEVGR